MNENISYMIFVLGYDLLQETLDELDIPCDVAYEKCKTIYDNFLCSKEYLMNKSEYECLQDYLKNHMIFVEKILVEP